MYRDAVFRRDMYSRGSAVDTCIAFVSNMYLMRIACAHVNTCKYMLNTHEYVYRAQTHPKVSANPPTPPRPGRQASSPYHGDSGLLIRGNFPELADPNHHGTVSWPGAQAEGVWGGLRSLLGGFALDTRIHVYSTCIYMYSRVHTRYA